MATNFLEHTKNYLVNIQVFGDKLFEGNPRELHYLATNFEINHSGGSEFVHQKGRTIASAFATQPSVSVSLRCYMSDEDFIVLTSQIITEQQQILLTIGKIRNDFNIESGTLVDETTTVYEIIGYMRDAKITANIGEFIQVDMTVNADDINEYDMNNLPDFKY